MPWRRLFLLCLLVWAGVPGWSGNGRLDLLGGRAVVYAERVALDPADPARRRVGRLTYMGGLVLRSPDPAFGGFSSLTVRGDRFTLLSDYGAVVRFRLRSNGQVVSPSFGELPAGPGTGWRKFERDSEGMTTDPKTGQIWVSFERANHIWRYAADFARAEAVTWPRAMWWWPDNGGAETLVRRRDGSFIVIQEESPNRKRTREGLVWRRDPTADKMPLFRFRYRPPPGTDPSDATELPDGRILVLNRWWKPPLRLASVLVALDPRTIRPGATARGEEIARIGAPLTHDNFEGIAATVEHGRTIIWLVSDDNQLSLQRTLLLKFALN